MTSTTIEERSFVSNPLDAVEELVTTNDWPFQRTSEDELLVEIAGRWCDYKLFFVWQEEFEALQFCCRVEAKVPKNRRPDVYALLAAMNERMWIGHFDIVADEEMPMFRHTVLTRGLSAVPPEQIEDVVEAAVVECERFYPAFQMVIWGGKTAEEAIAAAILDPVGEA
jgi:hypothetical protein